MTIIEDLIARAEALEKEVRDLSARVESLEREICANRTGPCNHVWSGLAPDMTGTSKCQACGLSVTWTV